MQDNLRILDEDERFRCFGPFEATVALMDLPLRSHEEALLPAALAYAQMGWRVLPLYWLTADGRCCCNRPDCGSPGKHPFSRLVQHGLKDASSDPERIKEWWKRAPHANVGLVTGGELLVVDLDRRGGASLESFLALLSEEDEELIRMEGCLVFTGAGSHLYFSKDPALLLPNSTGKLGPGIDIRGDGGYVVAPPSLHYSGRRYGWGVDFPPLPLPPSLLDLLQRAQSPTFTPPEPRRRVSPPAFVAPGSAAPAQGEPVAPAISAPSAPAGDATGSAPPQAQADLAPTSAAPVLPAPLPNAPQGNESAAPSPDAEPASASSGAAPQAPPVSEQQGEPRQNGQAQAEPPRETAPAVTGGEAQAGAQPASEFICQGTRHTKMVSTAGRLYRAGLLADEVATMLANINARACRPPLRPDEIEQIARTTTAWARPVEPIASRSRTETLPELLGRPQRDMLWIVRGLLPEGLTLLAGKPKMGKSWLALQLALAVTLGEPALDSLATTQGEALYLGLEDSERRMAERTTRLLRGKEPPKSFSWAPAWQPLGNGGLADLVDWLEQHSEARLIVIDTLARIRDRTPASGSLYEEDYRTLTPLKQLAEERHLALVVIHHLRKSGAADIMDEISGTTGLTGASDCNIVLQRGRNESSAALHITGRDVEEQELALKFEEALPAWRLQGPAERPESERDRVLKVLREAGKAMSPSEIAQKLGHENSDRVRQLLSKSLLPEGEVRKVEHGLYAVDLACQQDVLLSHNLTMDHEPA